jgi:hypothetical protein
MTRCPPRCLAAAQSARIHAQRLKLSNSDTFVSSPLITRSDVPKFASDSRNTGTSEENKAAVQGSIAYFGTLLGKRNRWCHFLSHRGQHVPKLERHPTGTTFQTFGGRTHLDQFYYVHRCWNRLLGLESREVGGGRRGKTTLAHEFSVQMRSMDNAKTGSGLGWLCSWH